MVRNYMNKSDCVKAIHVHVLEVVWRSEQRTKNRFIEGQTPSNNACGAKMSLIVNAPISYELQAGMHTITPN